MPIACQVVRKGVNRAESDAVFLTISMPLHHKTNTWCRPVVRKPRLYA